MDLASDSNDSSISVAQLLLRFQLANIFAQLCWRGEVGPGVKNLSSKSKGSPGSLASHQAPPPNVDVVGESKASHFDC